MKELNITANMQKYQDIAKAHFAKHDGKRIDTDAVQMGWKIAPGRVIIDEVVGATITILTETERGVYNVHIDCPTKGIDREVSYSLLQVAAHIIKNNATVYYAK